jgi:glycerophosphoryl diester phosphodiesterase
MLVSDMFRSCIFSWFDRYTPCRNGPNLHAYRVFFYQRIGHHVAIMSQMLLIAHRGGSGEAAENTLPAFDLAFRGRADGVEADVRLTADGVPIMIHDARFDRTALRPGRVSETISTDLPELHVNRWPEMRESSVHPPRLQEVVRWSAENRVPLRLHCKGVEREIMNLVRLVTGILWAEGDGAAPAEILSSSPVALAAVRESHPGVKTGLVVSERVKDPLARVQAARANWLNMPWASVTETLVQQAHDASLLVDAWTVNSVKVANALQSLGVDSIATDYPVAIRSAMATEVAIAE